MNPRRTQPPLRTERTDGAMARAALPGARATPRRTHPEQVAVGPEAQEAAASRRTQREQAGAGLAAPEAAAPRRTQREQAGAGLAAPEAAAPRRTAVQLALW